MIKNFKLIICLIVFFTSYLFSQGDLKIADIGDLSLTNGGTIISCKVGYRVLGEMNKDKSNIILFPTWFGGNSEDLLNLIGPNKLVDTDKFFVIAVDALGNGISSSPSNSEEQPDSIFPVFNIKDMVSSQYKLLTKILKINHIYAVVGGSMGGMQTFQWITSYPNFMDKAVSYVGSPKLTSYDLLLWKTELDIIEQGHKYNISEDDLIKDITNIQTLNIQTPQFRVNQTNPEDVDSFMDERYEFQKKYFKSYDWESQLKAMMQQDITSQFAESMKLAAEYIKARVLIIVNLTDHMVNPNPAMEIAKIINSEIYIFNNKCGHLGPGCEMKKFEELVETFLSN